MPSKNTISITEARKRFFDIAKEVQRPGTVYTLTENGRRKVAVLGAQEFDSLMETLEILSDPKAMKQIAQAEKELGLGQYTDWDDFKKEWGYPSQGGAMLIADTAKKPYQVRKKRAKK